MNDKEKKLTEALKEYFGRDVGDVEGEPNFMDYSTKLPGLVHPCLLYTSPSPRDS